MLEEIQRTLNIEDDDLKTKGILADFIKRIQSRLLVRLGEETLPEALQYIVIECVVKRYNMIGNEGMTSYSQEGESISYGNYLDEYRDDIAEWKYNRDKQADSLRGVVRFL